MATIDTSAIEGFDSFTPEQKVEALLKLDIPEKADYSGWVKKELYDKTASDLSKAKKDLQGKMTEDEAANAERQAQWDELVATNKAQAERIQKLELASTEAKYKAKYLAMPGFDEKLAEETAKAMASGDMEKVFLNQQKANEAYKKQVQAEMVKGDPKPGGAGGAEAKDEGREYAKALGKKRAEARKASQGLERFTIH